MIIKKTLLITLVIALIFLIPVGFLYLKPAASLVENFARERGFLETRPPETTTVTEAPSSYTSYTASEPTPKPISQGTATFTTTPTASFVHDAVQPDTFTASAQSTLPVKVGVLEEGFAKVHVDAKNLPFLSWNTVEVVAADQNSNESGSGTYNATSTVSVIGEGCGESLLENVKKVYQAFRNEDWHTIGAMVLTESGFKQFVEDGSGGCKLLQNYAGAPAYCMMQIYSPAHPNTNVKDLTNVSYCIEVGRSIYLGMLSGADNDPVQAVACYKGFCQPGMNGKYEPDFIANYMGAYNASGFSVEGTFIPWDRNELEKLFPEW